MYAAMYALVNYGRGVQWVQVGEPEVHRQRGKWVVRQSGYDPTTGKRKVRQLGTFDDQASGDGPPPGRARRPGGDRTPRRSGSSSSRCGCRRRRAGSRPSTFDQYRWAVDRHIVPLIGTVRLRDLRAEVVDGWVAALVAADDDGKPRLGATSARLVRKVLSMALEEAVQRGRLGRNPVG